MLDVVVTGGGWGGVSAALSARMAGAEVTLLERTDMLLGTGLVGGIMRNNGRLTADLELIELGSGELYDAIECCIRHRNVSFPGHEHAELYDVALMEPAIRGLLKSKGIDVIMGARVNNARVKDGLVSKLITDTGGEYTAAAFIDATGTAGPQANCARYGCGCCVCVLRCAAFGGRVSITKLVGAKEVMGLNARGEPGAMSGSCKLNKDSLSKDIRDRLDSEGVAVIPIPESLQRGESLLSKKACRQYAQKEFAKNLVLLDTGPAKLMTPYYPIDELRAIPGLEWARFEDPYAGGLGNSIRFLALSAHDNTLRVEGMSNLFCAGEKAGSLVGHTEAIATGMLAGHNAARLVFDMPPLELPTALVTGDIIAYATEAMKTQTGLSEGITFSGSAYFERMLKLGLYTSDTAAIHARVAKTGLANVYSKQLIKTR